MFIARVLGLSMHHIIMFCMVRNGHDIRNAIKHCDLYKYSLHTCMHSCVRFCVLACQRVRADLFVCACVSRDVFT